MRKEQHLRRDDTQKKRYSVFWRVPVAERAVQSDYWGLTRVSTLRRKESVGMSILQRPPGGLFSYPGLSKGGG